MLLSPYALIHQSDATSYQQQKEPDMKKLPEEDNVVDWPSMARRDLDFFNAYIENNHPGPVNPLDPRFSIRKEEAYRQGLLRSKQVNNLASYLWMMHGYSASFNDGHLGIHLSNDNVRQKLSWPGFLTTFTSTGQQVVTVIGDNSPVPLGATLVSCNGMDASNFANATIGMFVSAWQLASQRHRFGYRLFLDEGNIFSQRPAECTFTFEGKVYHIDLEWKELDEVEKKHALSNAIKRYTPETVLRELDNNAWWLSLPSFDTTDSNIERTSTVIQSLKKNIDCIKHSNYLVVDLRGNNGGSSDWPYQVASILWGERAVNSLPDATSVDWRASNDNLKAIEKFQHLLDRRPASNTLKSFIQKTATGLSEALRQQSPFYTELIDRTNSEPSGNTEMDISIPVYLLTDELCTSATLDAVDCFRGLGAIHVGRETSGDTPYMDINEAATPSGLAKIHTPMKVYRNRPRGSLQTWKPHFYYEGELEDTTCLEHWIAALPSSV